MHANVQQILIQETLPRTNKSSIQIQEWFYSNSFHISYYLSKVLQILKLRVNTKTHHIIKLSFDNQNTEQITHTGKTVFNNCWNEDPQRTKNRAAKEPKLWQARARLV